MTYKNFKHKDVLKRWKVESGIEKLPISNLISSMINLTNEFKNYDLKLSDIDIECINQISLIFVQENNKYYNEFKNYIIYILGYTQSLKLTITLVEEVKLEQGPVELEGSLDEMDIKIPKEEFAKLQIDVEFMKQLGLENIDD